MNNKTGFLLVIISSFAILMYSNKAFAQSGINSAISKVNISSPNAASLGKYGDIPVSYHTGIPGINIPLYSIKSVKLELPISLSYHASGLKVQEQASWVGAGWSLNAGGMITRSVIGAPDDRGLFGAATDKGHFSDFGYNSYLFGAGPALCSPSVPAHCPTGGTTRPDIPAGNYPPQDSYIQTGKFDGEPDLYFFNFSGYSGKFYFNDDRTPVIVPQQDLQIVPIYTGTDWRGMTGFIITTPDGTMYYFGINQNNDGNKDAIEITYNITTQSTFTGQGATSGWYLNKMVSADRQDSIILSYQQESYSYYTLSMYPIPSVNNPNWYAYNNEYDLDKNFINGVRLSKINFANGEVDFNAGALRTDLSLGTGANSDGSYVGGGYTGINDQPNTSSPALGSISVTANNFCKKYSFFTSYFYDPTTLTGNLFTNAYPALGSGLQSDKYRLRLDSIQETTCDNTLKIPPYKFDYFSGTVPRKLSFGIDHWGFSNGIISNNGLIPTYTVIPPGGATGTSTSAVTVVQGANRDPHWPASLSGTIQKISYPTGGSTQFEFEPNSVYGQTNSYGVVTLANPLYGIYGQAVGIQTKNFTVDPSTNSVNVSLISTSNYSATLVIKDNSNTTVYSAVIPNWDGFTGTNVSTSTTISLPAGNYQAILSPYPTNYSFITGGVQSLITQWQNTIIVSPMEVGGIRVKTITNNDATTSINNVTSYGYNFDNLASGHSSGQLFSRPVYVQALRNDAWGLVSGAMCSTAGCFTCFGSNASYYKSPSSIRPMVSSQGNHIGYAEVYVSQAGNGRTMYRYYVSNGAFAHSYDPPVQDVCVRTLSTLCDPALPTSPAPPDPFDPMRGELASESHFSETGQLLESKNYIPLYQFDSLTTPGIIDRFFVTGYQLAVNVPPSDPLSGVDPSVIPSNSFIPIGISTFTEYFLRSARKVQDSVITTTYDPSSGNYLTSINAIYYGSKYHNQPTQKLFISSKGENLLTNFTSAFDLRISNFNQYDQLSTYNTNIAADAAYLNSTIAGITNTSDPYYQWNRLNTLGNYRYMKAIDRQRYIAARISVKSSYVAAHTSAKSSANAELKPIFELQDEYNNPTIETTNWKNSSLLTAGFTRYDYATIPSGYVYPNKTQTVNSTSLITNFTNTAVTGNTLLKDSRYKDEVFVKFDKGNMVEITAKDGITTSYLWGYNNALPIAKAIGINQSTLSTAYIAAGNNLAQLRNQSSVSGNGVQLNTYVYTPLVGMTAQTDANGKSITYEYDGLGRLLLVRDFNNNILKQYEYKYQNQIPAGSPQWTATGNTRCKPCPQNSNYITNILQNEEKDNNPNSGSYNTLRWNDVGVSSSCVSNADWQNTTTPVRCQQNNYGQNTGWQEQEQMDMNPCSITYGQKQWIAVTYNPTICPIPVTCNSGNCSGVDKKCINNVCETGVKIYTSSVKNNKTGLWTCTYHYRWSDGSISIDYYETSSTSCNVIDGG